MKYDNDKREIILDKNPNELDKFTLDFLHVIEKHIGYVIVSDYVSILLGRSRASEDVDFLVPPMSSEKFGILFKELDSHGYVCMNTSDYTVAYKMLDEHAIRFYNEVPVPNIEFKKITNKIQEEAYNGRLKVVLGNKSLFISPLELQIVYKLSLMPNGNFDEISSDKDFEDAKHLYETFKEQLDEGKIIKYVSLFGVEEKWEWLKK